MEHEVKVGRREAILVMSRRVPVRLSDIGSVIGTAFGEVYGYLGAHGGEPGGPPFVIYHGMPGRDDPFDVEICAPVARRSDAPPGWQIAELPAGMFATLLHIGPYDTLGAGYTKLTAWLGSHDMTVAGPPREVYLSEPDTPPDRVKTIIEFPVADVAAPVTAG
jgi:effector-binding domain-containing protein